MNSDTTKTSITTKSSMTTMTMAEENDTGNHFLSLLFDCSCIGNTTAIHQPQALTNHVNDDIENYPYHILKPPDIIQQYSFSFCIQNMPILHHVRNDLTSNDLKDLTFINTPGSNSTIYTAIYKNMKVIVKVMKQSECRSSVASAKASLEFDLEHAILCRVKHPNIVRILGAGSLPRRFLVLEYLEGGTLSAMLRRINSSGMSFLGRPLPQPPVIGLSRVLVMAADLAQALAYLHSGCHSGASILHRDLKPDNIGLTKDGRLKLFDFGLCSAVRSFSTASDAYELSGFTGSMRYMAPEVALMKPYNEKVDVHSFGVIVWQIATGKTPFENNKINFVKDVVEEHFRPEMNKNWPLKFQELLSKCWDPNPGSRPSFSDILQDISLIVADANTRN